MDDVASTAPIDSGSQPVRVLPDWDRAASVQTQHLPWNDRSKICVIFLTPWNRKLSMPFYLDSVNLNHGLLDIFMPANYGADDSPFEVLCEERVNSRIDAITLEESFHTDHLYESKRICLKEDLEDFIVRRVPPEFLAGDAVADWGETNELSALAPHKAPAQPHTVLVELWFDR